MKKSLFRIIAILVLLFFPIIVIFPAIWEGIKEFFNSVREINYLREFKVLLMTIKTGNPQAFYEKEREERIKNIREKSSK